MTAHSYHFLDKPLSLSNSVRFYFIRHAIVNDRDRSFLYGTNDVKICPTYLNPELPAYQFLAKKLPQTPHWFVTHLSRTHDTALQIQQAGYGKRPLQTEDAFLEQNLGNWQGLPHHDETIQRQHPAHPFWPFAAHETPPQGENMNQVRERVGAKLETFSQYYNNQNVIIIAHGGTIRAALAHVLHIPMETALSFSIYNLSLTILEKHQGNWRVLAVNETGG